MRLLIRLFEAVTAWADTDADRGNGPLQRCQACRRARRDVTADLCTPCSLRCW